MDFLNIELDACLACVLCVFVSLFRALVHFAGALRLAAQCILRLYNVCWRYNLRFRRVTLERVNTGPGALFLLSHCSFFAPLPPAVLAIMFMSRRVQPFLSLANGANVQVWYMLTSVSACVSLHHPQICNFFHPMGIGTHAFATSSFAG